MMNSKRNKMRTVLVAMIALLSACTDFVEPSIEKKETMILAPVNGAESIEGELTFWWEEVEHALGYRLQVVSPGFKNAVTLHLDTLVNTYKFTDTLGPGVYEWRVRAENGSSRTEYAKGSFVIHPSAIDEKEAN